jgi:hypothetical protein
MHSFSSTWIDNEDRGELLDSVVSTDAMALGSLVVHLPEHELLFNDAFDELVRPDVAVQDLAGKFG